MGGNTNSSRMCVKVFTFSQFPMHFNVREKQMQQQMLILVHLVEHTIYIIRAYKTLERCSENILGLIQKNCAKANADESEMSMSSKKNSRSRHQRCSMQKGVRRNFTKFKGKHLCQSLFFNKVTSLRPGTFSQNTSGRLLLELQK